MTSASDLILSSYEINASFASSSLSYLQSDALKTPSTPAPRALPQKLHYQASFLDPQVLVLTAIFVAIVVGNVPVVITIIFGKLSRSRMYYFLLHLCLADLITGCFNVIPQLAWELTRHFYGGNILCKTVKYLQILGPYLSSYTLAVMSIDRFLAICHPLTNNHLSLYRAKMSIGIAWILSLIFCIPQALIFSYMVINDETQVMECWATFPIQPWGERVYVTWYAVSVFIVPFVIIFFTHFKICCELWKTSKERRLTQKQRKKYQQQQVQQKSSPSGSDSSPGMKKTRFSFPSFNTHSTRRCKDHLQDTHHRNESEGNAVKESLLSSAMITVSNESNKEEEETPAVVTLENNHNSHQNVNFNHHPKELHLHHNRLDQHLVNEEEGEEQENHSGSRSKVLERNPPFLPPSIIKSGVGRNVSSPPAAASMEFVHIQGLHGSNLIPASDQQQQQHEGKKPSPVTGSFEDQEGSSSGRDEGVKTGNRVIAVNTGLPSTQTTIQPTHSSSRLHSGSMVSMTASATLRSPSMDRVTQQQIQQSLNRCISQEEEHLRAKIKSVKLTVTVIFCYVFCSLPFICVQLWAQWYPGAQESGAWTGMSSSASCIFLLFPLPVKVLCISLDSFSHWYSFSLLITS